jgi:hypothetical protein
MGGQNSQQILLQAGNVHRKESRLLPHCASSLSSFMYDRVRLALIASNDQLDSLNRLTRRYQQIKYEIDPEYLFSPTNGEGKLERKIVESYFKVNYTHRFNVGRITRPGKLLCTHNRLITRQPPVRSFLSNLPINHRET